jgi:hypothetical protein
VRLSATRAGRLAQPEGAPQRQDPGHVIALAARSHRQDLPLTRSGDSDQVDVSRRTAHATTPVTLRLNGAQRELLDELASQHTTTRSCLAYVALTLSDSKDGST